MGPRGLSSLKYQHIAVLVNETDNGMGVVVPPRRATTRVPAQLRTTPAPTILRSLLCPSIVGASGVWMGWVDPCGRPLRSPIEIFAGSFEERMRINKA